MLFKNSNLFIMNMDTQYDDQFAVDGAKIGDTLRIRLPSDFVVTDGPAMQLQDNTQQFTSLIYLQLLPCYSAGEQRLLAAV